jgi:hypothetical protein
VRERHGLHVNVAVVVPHEARPAELDWDGTLVLDADGAIHARFGARSECLYLIRPDKYVAYRCQPAEGEKLERYLGKIFLPGDAR